MKADDDASDCGSTAAGKSATAEQGASPTMGGKGGGGGPTGAGGLSAIPTAQRTFW